MDSGAGNDYSGDATKDGPLTQDDIDRFISSLRAEADAAHFSNLAEPAVARASRPSLLGRLRIRAAAVAAAVIATFGGLGGVAYAANGAAPGDFLYGIDRALESVGIGNGGSAERLQEAAALVDRGRADRALQHAAEILPADIGAQAALLAAAERIGELGEAAASEGVAALLTYLSENVGAVDGETVAELARAIAGPPDSVTPGGPPEGVTPGGPPDEVPQGGPPEDVTQGESPEDEAPGGPPEDLPKGGPPDDVPRGGPPDGDEDENDESDD